MDSIMTYTDDEASFPIPTIDHDLMDTLCSDIDVEEIDESILNDIELHLECDDDGNSYSLQKPKPSPTTLICDVNIQISEPLQNGNLKEMQISEFHCYVCQDTFNMESKFRQHMTDCHQIERPFQCRFCDYSSTCTKLMLKHSKRKHIKENLTKNFIKTDFNKMNHMLGNGTSKSSVEMSKPQITKNNRATDNSINIENESEADISSQTSDTIDQVFFCCKCPYQTTTKNSLISHVNSKHVSENKKQYSCSMCDFICKQKRTLEAHTKKHEGKSSFLCEICDKSFYMSTALKRHIVTHNQDRPYACTHENCMKSFKHQGALTDHVKTVHLKKIKNSRKPTESSGLSKVSENENSKTEAENSCKDSGIANSDGCLKEISEDSSTQFKCTWKNCGKSFRDNFNLRAHMAIHTGKKRRHCPHCDFTCIQKTSLDWHLKKNHSDLIETTKIG